jgi:hypothetical protein
MPAGATFGARGPFAMIALETALNRWLRKAYVDRFSVAPNWSWTQGRRLLWTAL